MTRVEQGCIKDNMIALLVVILLVLTGIFAGLVVLLLNLRAVITGVATFTKPGDDGEFSPLETHLNRLASSFAERVTARLTGIAGGQAKREKAVEGAAALDMINMAAPPWLQTALSLMPELKKKISKNPNMIGPALQMFAKAGGNGNGNQAAPPADEPEQGGFDL